MIYICCVGFASLDVVCDELNDCAWNVGCFVSTHSLYPCLWGESVHPAFSPPASISLYFDSVVRMWVQLKRWCVWVLQRGHSGDGCDLASTLWAAYSTLL